MECIHSREVPAWFLLPRLLPDHGVKPSDINLLGSTEKQYWGAVQLRLILELWDIGFRAGTVGPIRKDFATSLQMGPSLLDTGHFLIQPVQIIF